MLKACPYCHKFHKRDKKCPLRPKFKKKGTKIEKFRNTASWQKKRKEIVERDLHMCRLCAIGYDSDVRYESSIEVHHIVPMSEDFSMRLDNDNLVSLCYRHHAMAEDASIPRSVLRDVIASRPGA